MQNFDSYTVRRIKHEVWRILKKGKRPADLSDSPALSAINAKEDDFMRQLIEPTLYIDIQAMGPGWVCPDCGEPTYVPEGPCPRCRRREP